MRSPCRPWSRDFPDQGAGGGSALGSRLPAQSGVGHETRPETVGFSTIRPSLWFCPRNQPLLTLSTRASQAARGVLLVLPRRRPGLRRARGEDWGPLSPAAPGGGDCQGSRRKWPPSLRCWRSPRPIAAGATGAGESGYAGVHVANAKRRESAGETWTRQGPHQEAGAEAWAGFGEMRIAGRGGGESRFVLSSELRGKQSEQEREGTRSCSGTKRSKWSGFVSKLIEQERGLAPRV